MSKESILNRLCQIEGELTALHYENKRGTPDPFGTKRRQLSEEWVFLSRQLTEGCPNCRKML